MRYTIVGLLVIACAGAAFAADPAVKGKVQTVWQARELPLSIPTRQGLTLPIPAVPAREGYLRVLRLQARLDSAPNGGWNTFLGLEINGQKVLRSSGESRNAPQRVLNRDLLWKPPAMEQEEIVMRDNRLNVVFAPDFKQFDKRLEHEGKEAFWYVLDVSDLLKTDGENELRLTNTAQPVWFEGRDVPIVLGDISVGYLPVSYRTAAQKAFTRKLPSGKSVRHGGYKVIISPGGGMAIEQGGEYTLLETSLTWPDGSRNWLSCPDRNLKDDRPEWKIVKTSLGAQGGQVVAQGKYYRLTRDLKFDGPRLRLSDRIENLTAEDLGMELTYHVSAGASLAALYLAGDGNPETSYVDIAGANPTVFAGQTKTGLGLLCEDDVLRNQLRLQTSYGDTRAYSAGFGLAPKASYTCQWTLYPQASPDYWQFINQVRRDWDVNFPIEGPFVFFGQAAGVAKESLDSIRERTRTRQVKLAAMHPWTNYQYPYSREEHKANWLQAQAKVHEVDAKIKCLVLMEPPLESRVHKEKVDEDPYRDAMVINPDGKVAFDLHYGPNYVGKDDFAAGWRLVWRYPTLENSWMKYLDYDVDFAMKDCGADGMYIDCFSYGSSRNWCRYTYDRWDGHTVELDPKTHRIARKCADLGLLSATAQQRVIERIQNYGGTVVANSEPCTANMRKLRINRFVETGSGARYDSGTHLYTPIALGFPWYSQPEDARNPKGFMADVVENLKYGALYYYYSVPASYDCFGVINRMFPFTPRELRSGWLVGEERIITSKSGQYGWGDTSGAKVFHYDAEGKEKELPLRPKTVGKANVWDIKLEPGEVVILERVR